MSTATNTGRSLRINGYNTNDGVDIRHDSLLTLRFESFKPIPGAGKRVAADLAKVVSAFGAPLVRIDDHAFIAIFCAEYGRGSASLHDARGRIYEPAFRFTGDDTIIILKIAGSGRDGIRTDGRWENSRNPLNTPRRDLPVWPYEAENDLRQDLDAALNTARERGDLRWIHEDAAPVQVHRSWVEREYSGEPDLRDPRDIDPTDPIRSTPGAMDALRARRAAAGLDKPKRRSLFG